MFRHTWDWETSQDFNPQFDLHFIQHDSSQESLFTSLRELFSPSLAMVVSFLFHLLLFVVIAAFQEPQQPSGKQVLLISSYDSEREVLQELTFNSPATSDIQAELQEQSLAEQLPVEVNSFERMIIRSPWEHAAENQHSQQVAERGTSQRMLSDLGTINPFMEVQRADFYGIPATGQEFIFIVDASSSMRGEKWNSAVKELIESIEHLQPAQKYQIFFFGSEMVRMPGARRYHSATRVSNQRTRKWIEQISFQSSTRPLTSLRVALAIQPDAIFLLTDGEFDEDVLGFLQKKNRPGSGYRVPVHTVGLDCQYSSAVLQQIAAENGGHFREIDTQAELELE